MRYILLIIIIWCGTIEASGQRIERLSGADGKDYIPVTGADSLQHYQQAVGYLRDSLGFVTDSMLIDSLLALDVNDADNDSTNELQSHDIDENLVTLSHDGGTIDINEMFRRTGVNPINDWNEVTEAGFHQLMLNNSINSPKTWYFFPMVYKHQNIITQLAIPYGYFTTNHHWWYRTKRIEWSQWYRISFSGDWSDLENIPSDIADGDDDTIYNDTEVMDSLAAHRLDIDNINLTEVDPTVGSHIKEITTGDITNWNNDLVDDADNDPTNELYDDTEVMDSLAAHRLDIDNINLTEVDPTVGSHIKEITTGDITNWNNDLVDDADNDPTNELYDDTEVMDSLAAHRLDIDNINLTEVDPTVGSHIKEITTGDIANWDNDLVDDADNDPTNELYDDTEVMDSLAAHRVDIDNINLTEVDPTVGSHVKDITTGDIANWDNDLVDDADNDPTNELYDDTEVMDSLVAHRVDIDNINLTEVDPTVGSHIKGITTGDVANWNNDLVDDADNDPTNEFQSHAINENQLTLTDGGGSIDLNKMYGRTGVNPINDWNEVTEAGFHELMLNNSINSPKAWYFFPMVYKHQNIITQLAIPYGYSTNNHHWWYRTKRIEWSQWYRISFSGDWSDLENIPSDIADGDNDTQLTQEQVQDFVGTMLSGNTETNITVTYDDANNEIDFIVDGGTDKDWHKSGTTTAPASISDNIVTSGDVAIGKTTTDTGIGLTIEKNTSTTLPLLRLSQNGTGYNSMHFERQNAGGASDYTIGVRDSGGDTDWFTIANSSSLGINKVFEISGGLGIFYTNVSFKNSEQGSDETTSTSLLPKNYAYTSSTGDLLIRGISQTIYRATGSSTTATEADKIIYVNTSSGDKTVTLPVTRPGDSFHIVKSSLDANWVILNPSGGTLINGASTYNLLTHREAVHVHYDGSQYWILSKN